MAVLILVGGWGAVPLEAADRDFWSFQKLVRPTVPVPPASGNGGSPIDRFLLEKLHSHGLGFSHPADRATLIRRMTLDVLGLPPSPEEVAEFVADESPDACDRLIERLLASPQYGERAARQWLDVVGYSDSNGYHRADTPRPLAYRYRDYVIRAFNADRPYDRFWLEQLAGDELIDRQKISDYSAGVVDLLVATHFLRNGPDGTDSTEGNEMARTIERYAVLEQQLQITIGAMFGMTIDCARCHSHKFDPIPHGEYYSLQAILYPAFNVRNWTPPKERTICVATQEQLAEWEAASKQVDAQVEALQREFSAWVAANRPTGKVVFRDDFNQETPRLAERWSNTAPGDDAPAGTLGVNVDSDKPPGALVVDHRLHVIEAGAESSGWLVTREAFDWTPAHEGEWIQVTFDLVADRIDPGAAPAARIGYYLALHDYHAHGGVSGGNVLIDGNPAGGATVTVGYPGARASGKGSVGTSGYRPGRNFGIRVTNLGAAGFRLEQLVDWVAEQKPVMLSAADLPDGGFGFEYCCGRSFVVDNVLIEASSDESSSSRFQEFTKAHQSRFEELQLRKAQTESRRPDRPEEIAWVTDLSPDPPDVPRLKRGRYFDPGELVEPGLLSVLSEPGERLEVVAPESGARTTGRRLAFARWATRSDARASALLARVQVNRIWQAHFGRGLVETPENFGDRGQPPSHPELLEWLASEFVSRDWSIKSLHRLILHSQAYQQGSQPAPQALATDPDNRLLWSYPVRRLESEAVRDSLLAVAGALDGRL
ncbi:MAG: DUF1549 and DUF1553 domain-containing protein, partial [Planctomycetales bacterium]